MSQKSDWWNFTTQTFEPLPCNIHSLTPEQAIHYVPPSAVALFRCHLAVGRSVPDAIVATLSAAAGLKL
jgi:hypothetical protein